MLPAGADSIASDYQFRFPIDPQEQPNYPIRLDSAAVFG